MGLARDGDVFVGLVGFHRMAAPGPRPVAFTIVDASGARHTRRNLADTVKVVDAGYPVERIYVTAATLSLLDPAKQNAEEAKLNALMSRYTPERRWDGLFQAPAGDAPITSGFGVRRSTNDGPVNWAHEGTDFAVETGDPVRAAAAGRVALAEPLHVRGNAVVLDHGWGVFTGYYHLSQIDVHPGQDVAAGDVVGLAGGTGFSTGPHLHWDLRVGNVNVEPLEWLARPILDHPQEMTHG